MSEFTEAAPAYTPFFGVMGASAAMVFSGKYNFGLKFWGTFPTYLGVIYIYVYIKIAFFYHHFFMLY